MSKALLKWVARCFMAAASVFIICPASAQTNCGDPAFPAPAEILTNVNEAAGYNLVYHLPIPAANQAWASQADIPYLVNNSAQLNGSPFTRVAYYMKLESVLLGAQWVWVSMDAFSNDLSNISIPTGSISFQQLVTNMNIIHHALPARTGITGNIEFWSACYNPGNTNAVPGASDFSYDFGDEIIVGDNCYGSFQIHDFNSSETVIAYNGWAFAGASAEDLGVGNFPGANTDWTLADNAMLYDVRELYVFVDAGQAYQPTCSPVTVTLDASGHASVTTAMITDAAIGNCSVSDITLSQSEFDCNNLGENVITVTVTRNGTAITCTSIVTVEDNIGPAITATGTTLELGCDPTAADIEAALGSATATDNCGDLVPQVVTDAAVIIGENYSQSRHFTATDAANNSASVTRTITWPVNCNVVTQNTYLTDVSCASFTNGATPLPYVCYTHASGKVKKVSPKQFFYYAIVKAPALLGPGGSFYADVVQTKSCGTFKLFGIQGNQVRAYDMQCAKAGNGSEVSTGQGRVKIVKAVPGASYVISVKYETKALEGSSFTGAAPVCANSFETRVTSTGAFGTGDVATGSQTTIEARPNCVITEPVNVVNRIPIAMLDKDVSVYPNPSNNQFTLALTGSEPVTIRVYNANGKLVQSIRGTRSTVVRIGDNWENGVYFAEIISGNDRKTVRLVKSR